MSLARTNFHQINQNLQNLGFIIFHDFLCIVFSFQKLLLSHEHANKFVNNCCVNGEEEKSESITILSILLHLVSYIVKVTGAQTGICWGK